MLEYKAWLSQGETKRAAQSSLSQRRTLLGFPQNGFHPPAAPVPSSQPCWMPCLSPCGDRAMPCPTNHTLGSRGQNGLHRGTPTLHCPQIPLPATSLRVGQFRKHTPSYLPKGSSRRATGLHDQPRSRACRVFIVGGTSPCRAIVAFGYLKMHHGVNSLVREHYKKLDKGMGEVFI